MLLNALVSILKIIGLPHDFAHEALEEGEVERLSEEFRQVASAAREAGAKTAAIELLRKPRLPKGRTVEVLRCGLTPAR